MFQAEVAGKKRKKGTRHALTDIGTSNLRKMMPEAYFRKLRGPNR